MVIYAWLGGLNEASDKEVRKKFTEWKSRGIDTLLYNGGQQPEDYQRIGRLAKAAGLGFHSWIPTMVQSPRAGLDSSLYAINRAGASAFDKPAYVPYYQFLCPSKPAVYQFLEAMYTRIAAVDEVDAIHLDYIRYPDVILARGLWDKYGLVMDKEYPAYDYCYCKDCTDGFRSASGIDIHSVEDPTQLQAWKEYRYDLITKIVNRLADKVHQEGKQINAAVFPGPHSVAKKIVRQEWDQWQLDAFFPMLYNDFYLEGVDWIGKMTREGVASVSSDQEIISGLFICPDPERKAEEKDPEGHGLLPEELEAAIQVSMANGASGICLFTPDRMTEAHWEVFEKAIDMGSHPIHQDFKDLLNPVKKVMTYNIRYATERDGENQWEYRKEQVVSLIQNYDPILVGIQEGLLHQLEYMNAGLKSYTYIGVGRDDGKKKGEFSAIFYDSTRLNLLESGTFWLSPTPEQVSVGWDASMERICTYGRFEDIISKQPFWVFNTHFDHRGAQARLEAARLILEEIRRRNESNLPVVLMGDLNALPESPPIQAIDAVMDDGAAISAQPLYGPVGTFNAFEKLPALDRRIDYIFTKGLQVARYIHIDDRYEGNRFISDHLPVLAEIKFPGTP
jgi:endonuclease/exonuclease/phosphatase family metal-dependent hydrolase